MCRTLEAEGGAHAAGVVIGNPFTDVPDLATNVLVTTPPEEAERGGAEARRIAQFMWQNRQHFRAKLSSVDEALARVEASKGLAVLSDAADATSSGASGDSTCLLDAILRRGWDRRSLLALVDPQAVLTAKIAGVGSEVDLRLGGTLDPERHRSVEARVRIEGLHDGDFQYENGRAEDAGSVAVVRSGGCTILITSNPVYVVGQAVFRAFGLEPAEFDLVAVKSPNGFRTYYQEIAHTIVAVDCPGSTSADLGSLPYRLVQRPVFPLDPGLSFQAEVQYIEPGR